MQYIEESATRRVIGGWKPFSIVTVFAYLLLPVGFFFTVVQEEPAAIWVNLFIAAITVSLALNSILWERIELDAKAGEATFDQLKLRGRVRRSAPLKPISRIDVESSSSTSNNRHSRRMVLVTGHERTPFSTLFSSRRFDAEAGELNDWLKEVYGESWRDAASRFVKPTPSDTEDAVPEGVTRIRHPGTGLTVDIPQEWGASISLDQTGPLQVFGVTLLPRYTKLGQKRPPGDGGDWTTLIASGAEDAGFKLTISEGPLDTTLQDALEGPWSKQWGLEVLKTTPEVEIGGMHGFSISRKIDKGGSTNTFGTVGAPVATRQVFLGNENMHVEIVGMARLDHPDIQRALDAMFESIHLQ